MINYELAKQLKDAGFPKSMPLSCKRARTHEKEHECRCDMPDCILEFISVPTLSELIEACGDRFHALEQKMFGGIEVAGGKWIAYSNETNELNIEAHIFVQGQSPEEAVAKLWLELNKK